MLFNYDYQRPKVIAEIGCNHMGEIEIAKELIVLAKECGADVAKFQTRDNKLLLPEEQYNAPHPVRENSYGILMENTENTWSLIRSNTLS